MISDESYDVIIAGGGAAGLLLVHSLLEESPTVERILLIDLSFETADEKTWSFWARNPFPHLSIAHCWPQLEVQFPGRKIRTRPDPYRYYSLRSGTFREASLSRARSSGRVTFLEASVVGFSEQLPGLATVHTSAGDISAPWVFQSVKRPPRWDSAPVDNRLLQHFMGWQVKAGRDLFDPGVATLMDFDTPQRDGLTFFYILPYDRRTALIEYTLFSHDLLEPSQYEMAIRDYLSGRFGLSPSEYRIERVERGAIPMEDRRWAESPESRVRSIGEVAGLTKPSTGYTFMRIYGHALGIARALQSGESPPAWSGSSRRFRIYDMMLLYLLAREPQRGVEIFRRLFERNPMPVLFRFLDEESVFSDELAIMSRMPWRPFIRSFRKMSHRIFTDN